MNFIVSHWLAKAEGSIRWDSQWGVTQIDLCFGADMHGLLLR